TLLKGTLTEGYRILGIIGMYVLLVLSYYFMALSLKRLSISVAYAIWEVLGGICVALIGIFYFGETLSLYEKLGILLALSGILLINYAEIKSTDSYKKENDE
ncbi:multidrug efflux SMR transporter, partial [uncultured Helicobacter sp.]